MDNETWKLVKKSNKVSGFVGNDHNPVPLSDNEALKMLKAVEEREKDIQKKVQRKRMKTTKQKIEKDW